MAPRETQVRGGSACRRDAAKMNGVHVVLRWLVLPIGRVVCGRVVRFLFIVSSLCETVVEFICARKYSISVSCIRLAAFLENIMKSVSIWPDCFLRLCGRARRIPTSSDCGAERYFGCILQARRMWCSRWGPRSSAVGQEAGRYGSESGRSRSVELSLDLELAGRGLVVVGDEWSRHACGVATVGCWSITLENATVNFVETRRSC